ncbi:fibroblast growth factor receptor substrate 2 [Trichogramma pretiosum]|uniref:fibroblast growth factor receptor substrate 2 n=1 Tax=Trichogramma pretiosum TaxID=7493 RepID=UPI0006C94BB2|nr:fibroblast growth factor receptor substrate 2 [Trichogramma pretiosum]
MGCINSRTDINDYHPNIFQVINVDELGNLVMPGKMEVSDVDIILYQRNKPAVKWPLRCLRRYGYDAEIFSFEAGRRCSTGAGIYAFKCNRAAQLFNLVQTNIQQVFTNCDDTVSRDLQLSSTHSVPMTSHMTIPPDSNYLDPTPVGCNGRTTSTLPHSQQNGRLSSVGSSSGPLSPQGTMGSPSPPPVVPLSLPPPPPSSQSHPQSIYLNDEVNQTNISTRPESERNNNKNTDKDSTPKSSTISNSASSTGFLSMELNSINILPGTNASTTNPQLPLYMNVELSNDTAALSPNQDSTRVISRENIDIPDSRSYVNIALSEDQKLSTKMRPAVLSLVTSPLPDMEENVTHSYANLDASEIEALKKRYSTTSIAHGITSDQTPPPQLTREMSYAVLDLDQAAATDTDTNEIVTSPNEIASGSSPPDSPLKTHQTRYVTIDFNKTAALSHSVNSSDVMDEGSRKTRHNSTISDLVPPAASIRHHSSMSE